MRRNRSLLFGVGVNDSVEPVTVVEKVDGVYKQTYMCPIYRRWKEMLRRAYSSKEHLRRPNYRDVVVCDDWLVFSNFREWMRGQDWQGKQLDKDILYFGNREYSAERCAFVHPTINAFVNINRPSQSQFVGVVPCGDRGRYAANCWNPFTKKSDYLGVYSSELEAHLAWKMHKHTLACCLAGSNLVDDERVACALMYRYSNFEEPYYEP